MILLEEPKHLVEIDMVDTMYPTKMVCIEKDHKFESDSMTIYGFLTEGAFMAEGANDYQYALQKMQYFCLTGPIEFKGEGKMFCIIRYGYKGINQVGTSESNGRLSYIDGCTDTLLVSPPRMGDPCLNYLHFPIGIYQTQHLHPSIRMGIVIGGKGEAFQEPSKKREGWDLPLKKGCMFCLEEGEIHSFSTDETFMDIIAYHPDSDFGPTDFNHPMLNRTYIDHGKT
tara:strand:- start:48 stop:728 length:681 start_codon:yes stop_codon:yes gene_type:complete